MLLYKKVLLMTFGTTLVPTYVHVLSVYSNHPNTENLRIVHLVRNMQDKIK